MATATTEAATSSATPPRIVSLTRVGIRLRTGSESSADGPRIPTRDPPSPSTELNTSSRVAGGGSSGSSGRCSPPPSRSRVQWSTQNSIIKSFATGTRGTMTVSWEECPRSALIVKVRYQKKATFVYKILSIALLLDLHTPTHPHPHPTCRNGTPQRPLQRRWRSAVGSRSAACTSTSNSRMRKRSPTLSLRGASTALTPTRGVALIARFQSRGATRERASTSSR